MYIYTILYLLSVYLHYIYCLYIYTISTVCISTLYLHYIYTTFTWSNIHNIYDIYLAVLLPLAAHQELVQAVAQVAADPPRHPRQLLPPATAHLITRTSTRCSLPLPAVPLRPVRGLVGVSLANQR